MRHFHLGKLEDFKRISYFLLESKAGSDHCAPSPCLQPQPNPSLKILTFKTIRNLETRRFCLHGTSRFSVAVSEFSQTFYTFNSKDKFWTIYSLFQCRIHMYRITGSHNPVVVHTVHKP